MSIQFPDLPYARHAIEEADIEAVCRVLRSPWLTCGPEVRAFEEDFAERVGARYAISFSSGTAALHGAIFAVGIGPGDEVITTPLTFCATANAPLYQGARVVFADVELDTLTLDPGAAAGAVTPRTKAIIPMDYGGHPAQLDELSALADRHGIAIIEDACHALGATHRGRPVGGLSTLSVFSFHPTKHITTGEGGMVTTHFEDLAIRLRRFRDLGRTVQGNDPWLREQIDLGYNLRLSDFGAALGRSQLSRIEDNIARRRMIAHQYLTELRWLDDLVLPYERPQRRSAWHLFPIRVQATKRRALFRHLQGRGIRCQVHYLPVYLQPFYQVHIGDRRGSCPAAEAAYESLISLPMFHSMTSGDVARVVEAIREFWRWEKAARGRHCRSITRNSTLSMDSRH